LTSITVRSQGFSPQRKEGEAEEGRKEGEAEEGRKEGEAEEGEAGKLPLYGIGGCEASSHL
jgi:hypothetical protein